MIVTSRQFVRRVPRVILFFALSSVYRLPFQRADMIEPCASIPPDSLNAYLRNCRDGPPMCSGSTDRGAEPVKVDRNLLRQSGTRIGICSSPLSSGLDIRLFLSEPSSDPLQCILSCDLGIPEKKSPVESGRAPKSRGISSGILCL